MREFFERYPGHCRKFFDKKPTRPTAEEMKMPFYLSLIPTGVAYIVPLIAATYIEGSMLFRFAIQAIPPVSTFALTLGGAFLAKTIKNIRTLQQENTPELIAEVNRILRIAREQGTPDDHEYIKNLRAILSNTNEKTPLLRGQQP